MPKKDQLIRNRDQVFCAWCEKSYPAGCRACPSCGQDNKEFFKVHPDHRQVFIELWLDRDVWRSMRDWMQKLSMESDDLSQPFTSTKEDYFVAEAIEYYISGLNEGKVKR